jgi:hypothetical protein
MHYFTYMSLNSYSIEKYFDMKLGYRSWWEDQWYGMMRIQVLRRFNSSDRDGSLKSFCSGTISCFWSRNEVCVKFYCPSSSSKVWYPPWRFPVDSHRVCLILFQLVHPPEEVRSVFILPFSSIRKQEKKLYIPRVVCYYFLPLLVIAMATESNYNFITPWVVLLLIQIWARGARGVDSE